MSYMFLRGNQKTMASLKDYIKLMRPHHYIKNMLVFIALGCSGQIFSLAKFVSASAGFAAFCMMSSAVYIINDIQDRKKIVPIRQNVIAPLLPAGSLLKKPDF